MDDLIAFLRTRLDEDQEDAERGYIRGTDDPAYAGWDRTTLAEVPPLVAVRLLREVEAKRRILADYERYAAERRRELGGWNTDQPSPILMALAAVYVDHPDFRPEWAPSS